jgi:hypothetical protein
MTEYTSIVVLCEDRQQEVFARHFLKACGLVKNRRKIYYNPCPKGKQAGEQYVRQEYPKEVKTYRNISQRLSASLIILIDADTQEVAERLRQLESALVEAGIPPREPGEHIGIFIPKRNIETWIYYLEGDTVTEEKIYDHLARESDCSSSVEALARKRREPLPENAPLSMQIACSELERIL